MLPTFSEKASLTCCCCSSSSSPGSSWAENKKINLQQLQKAIKGHHEAVCGFVVEGIYLCGLRQTQLRKQAQYTRDIKGQHLQKANKFTDKWPLNGLLEEQTTSTFLFLIVILYYLQCNYLGIYAFLHVNNQHSKFIKSLCRIK